MGFNDREIVALLGAHALGRCHTDRSGYWGPWTFAGEFREICMGLYEIRKEKEMLRAHSEVLDSQNLHISLWFIIFLPLHVL